MTLMSLAAAPNVKTTAAALPCSKDDALDDQRRQLSIHPAQECSMCGDVGFSSELFRCTKCLHRFQHTYCSRYYPSMPSKDVCDWCSQETNPSAGSTSSINTSGMRARSAKPTNLGKRKVTAGADQTTSPLSGSPRKSVDLKSRKDFKVLSSSTSSCVNHKDALELLLEVAQRVAEGQVSLDQQQQQQEVEILNSHELSTRRAKIHQQQCKVEILSSHELSARTAKNEQQQVEILSNYEARRSGKTQQQLQVQVLSNHEAKRAKIQQQLQVEVLSSHDLNGSTSYNMRAKNVEVLTRRLDESRRIKSLQSPNCKRQRCENQQEQQLKNHQQQVQMRSGKDHQSQKLLTNSRSMGRRYKLLSDVLCQIKFAATNPTC